MNTLRISSLQKNLKQETCLLIEDKIDLFYLTGLDLSTGKLLVHQQGALLLVDRRYYEMCKKNLSIPVLECDPPSLQEHLLNPQFSSIHSLAFDIEKTSYKTYQTLLKITDTVSEQRSSELKLFPIDSPLKLQRAIKDFDEIKLLKEASVLGSQGFDFILNLLKEGITEEEVTTELEIFWKYHGSKSVAFDPIIAFGKNSSMPHYRAGKAILKKGDAVLVDIGVNWKHYHSDMSRVIFFGEPDSQMKFIHQIVENAQKSALSLCKPGVTLGELDKAARNLISKEGYGQFFTHSLGHGVGLEIHEFPTIKNTAPFDKVPLVPGMVITIEPGIYLPEKGGVRIEDTILITETGYENLTQRPVQHYVKL